MAAALVEPVALAVHLEDMDVVGKAVQQRPGEAPDLMWRVDGLRDKYAPVPD